MMSLADILKQPHDSETEAEIAALVADRLDMSGVPAKYVNVSPEPMPDGKPWVYLTGSVGSGKTYRACQYLKGWIWANSEAIEVNGVIEELMGDRHFYAFNVPQPKFISATRYFNLVKASYGRDGDVAAGTIGSIRHTRMLVLDDLGQEVPTQWAVSQLFELIDHRYSNGLTTVITSQFGIDDIGRRLAGNSGERQALAVVSRLAEVCTLEDLGNVDRRIFKDGGR